MTARHRARRAGCATLALAAAAVAAASPVRADSGSGHYREGEYDAIRNVLPAGQTGFRPVTTPPKSNAGLPYAQDQLPLYDDLRKRASGSGASGVTDANLQQDYKDASFGVAPGDVLSTEQPIPGLTILRDRSHDVPHIYGDTDADLAYGTGYVAAEDRLFLIDVLRHYGESRLSSFIGGSAVEMDCSQAQLTGYSPQELQAQIKALTPVEQALAQRYVDGINAYIDSIFPAHPDRLPQEYTVFGLPTHWTTGDIIAVAGLVGGIFGKGGGVESENAVFLRALRSTIGDQAKADKVFADFMETNDGAAPTTLDKPFPYENTPVSPNAPGAALTAAAPRDPRTTTCTETPGGGLPGPLAASSARQAAALEALGIVGAYLHLPKSTSNALLVDAAHSTTGRPVAVFGPQVAYFEPQILMEEDLHSPSFSARGSSFPGTNFIVELGHGPDYAWSATSAGTDNIDQYAELLCNPTGGPVDPQSKYYMYNGSCVPMYERTDSEVVPPSPGSPPPTFVGVLSLHIERTVHGPVLDRTTALRDGKDVPVAISSKRSTFMHEADSIDGFLAFNDPAQMRNAQDFLVAASKIRYTFNWFYADNRDIAYYQSGLLPLRAPGVHPDLPTWGTGEYEWSGWLGFDGHVHGIDPPRGYMTSWNNKGAPQFRSSDDQWAYGPVHRSQSLDAAIKQHLTAGGGKLDAASLTDAMESAATVDLRATRLLPDLLAIVGSDPAVQPQVALLRDWLTAGGHRVNRNDNGMGVYDHIKAIELFDAWYPRLVQGIFEPSLGHTSYCAMPELLDDAPSGTKYLRNCGRTDGTKGLGSSYIEGWYGFTQKALDTVLGKSVPQPDSQSYCGSASACEQTLRTTLQDATANASTDDSKTTRADDIPYQTVGLGPDLTEPWQNRPTFQQVVDIPGHRSDSGGQVGGEQNGQNGQNGAVSAVTGLPNTGTAPLGAAGGALGLLGLWWAAAVGRRRRVR